ncbi:SLC13 family permease [Aliifodinibius salicampi]|uniref:SLC13 family permease n=1 Tax=Fodinibius salicampi TaxID=1920655 RepID=A0ABT3PYJ6_9BACT|nr:SLC13 family permease [Fodinibius salicampi]MCW9712861.1 SLC13 family permease [Fodinibius salicampi]
MSFEIIFVFALLGLALFLFATDYVSFDVAAIILVVCLLASGILTPQEGFSGVSNPATITIAAMFVISEGLRRTGILNKAGNFFCAKMENSFWPWLLVMLLFVSFTSSFMNNTAVIMIFIPVMIDIATRIGISPSKLLMPLSFAGIFGGISTLIGTSTNLLVSSIVEDRGGTGFSMFDFTPMGLLFLGAGFLYMFLYGINAIPSRREEEEDELTAEFGMNEYLTDLTVQPGSDLIGNILDAEKLTRALDLDVLRIFKSGYDSSAQRNEVRIQKNDILRIRGSADEIEKLLRREDLALRPSHEWVDMDLQHGRDALVEAAVAPESSLEALKLSDIDFGERFGAVPLAIRHHGKLQQEKLGDIQLSGGDSILLSMSKERIQELSNDPAFVITSELDVMRPRTEKTPIVLGILAMVVGIAALGIAPIVVTAPAGVIALILTGCISTEEAYTAINWKIIMLLVGVLPLGTAIDKTGAGAIIAETLINLLHDLGPVALLSGLYLITTMITAIITTNASVALLAPIAFEVAGQIGVNPEPMVLAVSYAACLTFITPFGHHANTLIYGPGQYKFTDFTKIGLPLNLIYWIIATVFIPIIWPL